MLTIDSVIVSVFDLPEPKPSPTPVRVATVKRTIERPRGFIDQLIDAVMSVPAATRRRGLAASVVGISILASLGAMASAGPGETPTSAVPTDAVLFIDAPRESLAQAPTGIATPDTPPPTVAQTSTVPTTIAPAPTSVQTSPVTAPPRVLAKATIPAETDG